MIIVAFELYLIFTFALTVVWSLALIVGSFDGVKEGEIHWIYIFSNL